MAPPPPPPRSKAIKNPGHPLLVVDFKGATIRYLGRPGVFAKAKEKFYLFHSRTNQTANKFQPLFSIKYLFPPCLVAIFLFPPFPPQKYLFFKNNQPPPPPRYSNPPPLLLNSTPLLQQRDSLVRFYSEALILG